VLLILGKVVVIAPRVLGDDGQKPIRVLFRLLHQVLQGLGNLGHIHFEHFYCVHELSNLDLCLHYLCAADVLVHFDGHHGCQDAQDDDDHHHLDEREGLFSFSSHTGSSL